LERLVARHRSQLHGYLTMMTGSATEADDLFQETWLRVIRNPGSFREGAFNAWLWRIARNLLIDRLRRIKPTVSLDDDEDGAPALLERMAAPDMDPGREVDDAEIGRQIRAAVARLPLAQRDVFLLRMQGGLSFAEIAALRRVPLNTALGRMHYAVQRLRRELGGQYALLRGMDAPAEARTNARTDGVDSAKPARPVECEARHE
jgi:RNA polymerase sigma-70 factor (ECF subfamily)